jgi:hypothetical protein
MFATSDETPHVYDRDLNRSCKMTRARKKTEKQLNNDAMEKIKTLIINETPKESEVNISQYYGISKSTLDRYVTLDWDHHLAIERLKKEIIKYENDPTRNRPLNILMIAQPGSGKSHFIKHLPKDDKMKEINLSAVTFNMASLQNVDDLMQPLDAVRNLKVNDKFPLLFLDEFDSKPSYYSLLLPLLWDGELHLGHRDLELGKVVIVIAGSDPEIKKVMSRVKRMERDPIQSNSNKNSDQKKLVDLLSRINGTVLKIPELDPTRGSSRQVDKVCISLSLLEKRFGERLEIVPWALLHFIALNKFRYEVRSITHFIDLIPPIDEDSDSILCENLVLPLDTKTKLKESSLAYHLIADKEPNTSEDEDAAIQAIVDLWTEAKKFPNLIRFKDVIDW